MLYHEATDPLNVVHAAVQQRDVLRRDRRWEETDCAWAVFDGDEHIENNPQNWYEALDLARRKEIGLAISNPCFEFWYLLHYQDRESHITRQKVLSRLRNHIPDYEKGKCIFPDPLHPLTSNAIERAERLSALRSDLPEYSNPSTNVHSLVSVLLEMTDVEPG